MPQTNKPILVLGLGAWGTALALALHQNGNPTRLWGYAKNQVDMVNAMRQNSTYLPNIDIPETLTVSNDLEALMDCVDDVLIAVPSFAFADTLAKLKAIRPTGLRIVWGTKGIDPNSHKLLHDVVSEQYGVDTPMAALSGPSFAKEVAKSLPTAVSLTGNNEAFNQDLQARFHSPTFRVYINSDMIGIELCGVVKNVLAIAVGVCDGLGFGANARSALMTRGLNEMKRLCLALGGEEKTLMSLAGVGDVILTCTDNQSRNRRFGLALVKEPSIEAARDSIGQAIEGYFNAKQLYQLANEHKVDMPIVACLYRVLYEGAAVASQAEVLMSRDPSFE